MKKVLLTLSVWILVLIVSQAQTTISIPNCNDCAPEITTLNCAGATFNNTEFIAGEAFQGSMMVPYTGGNGQPLPGLSIASTGVTGLTADLVGGNLMSGASNLIFYVHGTPSGAGTASFEITFGGQTCTVNLSLSEQALASGLSCEGGNLAITDLHSRSWSKPRTSSYLPYHIFIGTDGRLYGTGYNGIGAGILGALNPVTGCCLDTNIPIVYPRMANYFTRPLPLPNFRAYQPNLRFSHVDAADIGLVSSLVAAITDDGELWVYGGGRGNTVDLHPATTRSGPADGIEQRIPVKVDAPNGLPWAKAYAVTYSVDVFEVIYACTTDGTWYSWGIGDRGFNSLGHTASQATGSIVDVLTPTPTIWSPAPMIDDGVHNTFIVPSIQNSIYIATDNTIRYSGSTRELAGDSGNDAVVLNQEIIGNLPNGVNPVEIQVGGVQQSSNIPFRCMFILGDDGNVYYLGNTGGSLSAPDGGLNSGYTGYTTALQIPKSDPGIFLTQILGGSNLGVGLGADSKIYAWNSSTPITEVTGIVHSDIVKIWGNQLDGGSINLTYQLPDGTIRTGGVQGTNFNLGTGLANWYMGYESGAHPYQPIPCILGE